MFQQDTSSTNNVVFGIDEPKIDQLAVEIVEVAERVNKKFLELDDLVSSTSSFYECESGTNFRNSFAKIKQNFPIVNKNILCYSSDLVKVKTRVYNTHSVIEQNFATAKEEVLSNSIDRYIGKL